ncbi:hypothetical protein [uncultured Draconibacterium sp.]|uniref:hypothetical protein n=1 Tax=uncultured Draconibacterium sp. TaxID=1573823 RepID=UPI002AA854D2|nr:hypothetical protein [uncultured Draconibacterium sp.]
MPPLSDTPQIIPIEVNLDYIDRNTDKPFNLPEHVKVKQGSIIQWVIKDFRKWREFFHLRGGFESGIKFTVYFDNNSPFKWTKESSYILNRPIALRPEKMQHLVIASGRALFKGEYKYGLKLFSLKNQDEPEYDEDPFIKVY